MFELNLTLPIFLVMFLAFMKALNAVFLKPIGEVIAKREKRIKDDMAESQSCRQQATDLLEGYERDLRKVRGEAQALIAETSATAQKQRTADLKKLHDEGQVRVAAEKAKIDSERVSLVDKLVEEEKILVETIVHKLLGSNKSINLDASNVKHALEESR
jgi:F-type H+-transporting ATPase subunit b